MPWATSAKIHTFGRVLLGAFAVGTIAISCASPPGPGEFGTARFAGKVKGAAPLHLIPPVTDRAGNVYVLYGDIHVPETEVFIGRVGGGWINGCKLTKGDSFGVHGWSGFIEDQQWYWSGDALVKVSGTTGDCERVLDHDPGTDANLLFRAVLPAVRDTPSRTTLVALVASPVDQVPFSAQVDLETEILTNIQSFQPSNASNVTVIGVGADHEAGTGVMLLQYTLGEEVRLEARFYASSADPMDTVPIHGAQLPEYGVLGYLQMSSGDLVAGLLKTGELVAFDHAGGTINTVAGLDPVGVHSWNGNLWLVGTANNQPVVAQILDRATVGAPHPWASSQIAASQLAGSLTLLDDRSLPSRSTVWDTVHTAMGAFPFLAPHSPVRHGEDTTLWLIAGPFFNTGGVTVTAFAMAPVGITYP